MHPIGGQDCRVPCQHMRHTGVLTRLYPPKIFPPDPPVPPSTPAPPSSGGCAADGGTGSGEDCD